MTTQPAARATHRGHAALASGNPHTRATAALAVTGLLFAALLAGCSASDKSSSASSRAVPAPAGGGFEAGPAQGSDGRAAAPGTPPTGGPTLAPAAVQRSVIYNGAITVRVADVARAADAAATLASGTGGYVSGDERQDEGGRSTATIVLRVPAAQFGAIMHAVAVLGTERDRQVSAQDVTEQVVDVSARLKTQQASVDRVRALLAQATSVSQIVAIEGELTQREADLESLEAQQRSLTDLAALSTITATLLGPDAAVTVVHKPQKGFVGGLKAGWHTFLSALTVLFTIIGAILPFVIVIGIPLFVIWRLARRRRRGVLPMLATATRTGPDVPVGPAHLPGPANASPTPGDPA